MHQNILLCLQSRLEYGTKALRNDMALTAMQNDDVTFCKNTHLQFLHSEVASVSQPIFADLPTVFDQDLLCSKKRDSVK